jgi:hypothetical protein
MVVIPPKLIGLDPLLKGRCSVPCLVKLLQRQGQTPRLPLAAGDDFLKPRMMGRKDKKSRNNRNIRNNYRHKNGD